MYKLLVFTALFGLSLAAIHGNYNQRNSYSSSHNVAASSDDVHAEIKALQSDVRHDGFDYALETTNGIRLAQSGDDHGNVHGDYEYLSPEGVHVKVAYIADENGYQPQSDLLPTPPPIPPAILKALEYIRTHPPKEENYASVPQYGGLQSHQPSRGSAYGRRH